MEDIVIRADRLGKQYRIGGRGPSYRTLRDALTRAASAPARWLRGGEPNGRPPFWALKDVSFEVRRGEVVGIIGRNGAGKSTLLKILSRITEPTEGEADLHGRVGSLLEVGTGFNPELTGRENVYLNGAILGMRRAEIARKFDEIVAFAEVEPFIDTPVKHYSSGMHMRLGFAVAAHLEPEILVVDEVLAVGDMAFQQKCLGKMGEVARGGRTVLFVSHNMQTIAGLCGWCICLNAGRVEHAGPVEAAIDKYYALLERTRGTPEDERHRRGSGEVRFRWARPGTPAYRPEEAKVIRFALRRHARSVRRCWLSAHLVDDSERLIAQCDSRFLGTAVEFGPLDEVEGELTIRLPWLRPGEYHVHLFALDGKVGIHDRYDRACSFQVLPILPYPENAPEEAMKQGAVLADFAWTFGKGTENGWRE